MKMPLRIACLALWMSLPAATLAALPEAKPEALGLDPERLARIDQAVNRAIEQRAVPGAVVLVVRHGKIAYARAFGRRAVVPEPEAMTRDSIFDMASLTKPVATATSIMILLEQGQLGLRDRLGHHLPEFANHGKEAITIEQLLRHRSGLIADNPVSDYTDGPEKTWERLARLGLVHPPGQRYLYSDLNFIILGRLVEKLGGQPLDEFAHDHIFKPLGLKDTDFWTTEANIHTGGQGDRTVPTESVGDHVLRGVVHDPRARALGGVAGHAGLHSTADDLAVFAQMILDGGRTRDGKQILSPLSVRAMIGPGATPRNQRRGLGWDMSEHTAPRGDLFTSPDDFGHTGFTGTSLWVDPPTETIVIVLTSRLHPDGKAPSPSALRSEVATIAAASILDPPAPAPEPSPTPPVVEETGPLHPVSCGIDVLVKNHFEPIRGKRVGLVTNQTGRTRSGDSTIDVLARAEDVKLVALFSPEHGIRGLLDHEVPDDKDESTGLPIHSLYGKTRKPTPESLEGIDVLVYDIQDVGACFYTYITTLGFVLEAAKEKGIPVVVLDRPNPIGGAAVDGPVRDGDFESFIAYHALPVRHGLTVGELARLFNAERKIEADLTVIPCEGWRRADLFDRTGLVWINPSPNMRSLTEALLYPGVGLLEATNLATGRGTDTPFERVGAPYIDPAEFASALNGLNLPGVRFVPIRFSPKERQFAGTDCGGVQIMIADRARFEPIDLGIGLALTLHRLYAEHWKPEGFLKMLADQKAYQAVLDGKTIDEVRQTWRSELSEFETIRSKYLLYR